MSVFRFIEPNGEDGVQARTAGKIEDEKTAHLNDTIHSQNERHEAQDGSDDEDTDDESGDVDLPVLSFEFRRSFLG